MPVVASPVETSKTYEVAIDSDGTAGWETKNTTIAELANVSNYSISIGREVGPYFLDDVGGTGGQLANDVRCRCTTTTNLELKYRDTPDSPESGIVPVCITAIWA